MFSLLWESWNFTHIIFVEETLTTQFTVMESTKLKTQQNALLASREHKQSPATIQDLKRPGKYKARNCCCTSTSGSAPFPSSLPWHGGGGGGGGGSPAWTWNTHCLFSLARLPRGPSCSASCWVLLGFLHQPASHCKDSGSDREHNTPEKRWVWHICLL